MYKISENLTILNIGHKKRDPHCSPPHTKMAASAWPGGGETAAADENKFCSLYKIKVGTEGGLLMWIIEIYSHLLNVYGAKIPLKWRMVWLNE